jgi:diacylglycerol kinase (ATP)
MRIGLVSNARSERNKRGLAEIQGIVDAEPAIRHVLFDGTRPMANLLAELADERIELIVTNGGDGTVQAVLTALLEQRPFATPPPLALLPRGMANMTAADVGLRSRSPAALARLLAVAAGGRLEPYLVTRRVLRVAGIAGARPQRGMFLGGAGLYEAVELCKGDVHTLGLKGEASHAVTLAWILLTAAFRGLEVAGIHGHDVEVALDGAAPRRQCRLLVLATTLDRLVLRSRPYWNTDGRPLRFTSIAWPARGLIRHARRILYGGNGRGLPAETFQSQGAARVELGLRSPFIIDGEAFEPAPDRPLVVTAPDSLRFVRL